MDLSIVTTLYCSAPYIEEFYRRASAAAKQITSDYELIFVDDGSPDNSLDVALSLYARDPRVRVIELSRNFGHHRAIMTGLEHVKGDLVFLLDSDLEEAPELLHRFYPEMQATGADVAYGVQRSRRGGFFEKMTGDLFYVILARRGTALVDAITSFSNRPLVFIFYVGSVVVTVSTVAGFALIVRVLFFGSFLPGWASLMVSLWFLGGLMIFCIGIVGIYLSRVFSETKERPYTVIRQLHERSE